MALSAVPGGATRSDSGHCVNLASGRRAETVLMRPIVRRDSLRMTGACPAVAPRGERQSEGERLEVRLRRYAATAGQPSHDRGVPSRSSPRRAAIRRGAKAGAEERTRTSTALRQQAPEACASANSATSALEETGRNQKYTSAGWRQATTRRPALPARASRGCDPFSLLPLTGQPSMPGPSEDRLVQRLRSYVRAIRPADGTEI